MDEAIRALDAIEQRVLGSLMEKERTVPSTYPMTLNALRTACNQTSGRNPVLELTDDDVTATLDRLRSLGLTRVVHASHGARTVKFRQVLDEKLDLDEAERAVLTLLLLRGDQTPGEIRSRADRLHSFSGVGEVEDALSSLAGRPTPLVEMLARRPGQKEARWAHLLGPTDRRDHAAASTVDMSPSESFLRDGAGPRMEPVRATHDTITKDYGERIGEDPEQLPLTTAEQTVEAGPARPVRSFQASAGIQGRQFAEQCDTLLRHMGFELAGRRLLTEVGVEIDQEATSPSGRLVWFEYKGSVQGNRPGLRRTDTLKKAIANGALLRALADRAPYVVITSHLPEAGSGAAMLRAAIDLGYLTDVICLYDPSATARLRGL